MPQYPLKRWLPPIAVGLVAILEAATGFAAKVITAALSASGTGCTTPSGQMYVTEAVGAYLDTSGNPVAVCTAYSQGATAWQSCSFSGNSCDLTAPTRNLVFLLAVDPNTLMPIQQLCGPGTSQPWGTATSCTFSNGTCTWTALGGGKN